MDRIESAVRADQAEAARLWVDDFAGFAAATGQAWAAAVAEHGEALLADPETAESHFLKALELSDGQRDGRSTAHGRSWRTASSSDGPDGAWTPARICGLRSTPSRASGRGPGPSAPHRSCAPRGRRRASATDAGEPVLTPQERQVAQLVQRGMSNREVAGQLFVSPRTVDFHLRNVFAKTGVTSRLELAQLTLT